MRNRKLFLLCTFDLYLYIIDIRMIYVRVYLCNIYCKDGKGVKFYFLELIFNSIGNICLSTK